MGELPRRSGGARWEGWAGWQEIFVLDCRVGVNGGGGICRLLPKNSAIVQKCLSVIVQRLRSSDRDKKGNVLTSGGQEKGEGAGAG
jgi:hypothetical protein